MPTPVYSKLFHAQQGLVGSWSAGPPPGFLWILRDFDAYNGGGIVSTNVFLEGIDSQAIYWAVSDPTGAPSVWHWSGRQVIPPPGPVTITTTGAWDVTLSGYELSLP